MCERSFKITVTFQRREDDGVRAWSDDVPGLVLSHKNVDGLVEDVRTALEVILSAQLGVEIAVSPLDDLRHALEDNGIVDSETPAVPLHDGSREYVAYCH